jgi:hypothetical protein
MSNRPAYAVSAVLPLEVRKLRAEAVELHSRAVLSGPGVQPPRGRLSGDRRDPLTDIVRRLDGLEEKVDMVLALLLRQERHEARGRSTPLELHGEGLRFHWHEPLAESESIELEVALNLLPPIEITCVACVERCLEIGGDAPVYDVDARFVAISEADRDELHRFMLTTERQKRRAQLVARKKGEAPSRLEGG